VPGTIQLSAVQPNPLPNNKIGMFRLTLDRAARVSIRLFNIRGQLVHRIFNGSLAAGTHSFPLHGINNPFLSLPTGVYLLQATNGGEQRSQKFILIH
jgi:hypothetical protein